jgi:hypothetical protein
MSEIDEPKKSDQENVLNLNENLQEETQTLLNIENKNEEKSEEILINNNEIIIKTFLQLFENFISEESKNLDKFNIFLTPDTKNYLLILSKESPDLFGALDDSLNKIVKDNKVDIKDTPEILVLVNKVYHSIKENNHIISIDPYQLIKILLHISFVIYIDNNKVENPQLLLDLLKLVESSIDLIKLSPLLPKKINCFLGLFCKN